MGAFTIPVPPMTIDYAPPQGKEKAHRRETITTGSSKPISGRWRPRINRAA